MEQQKSKGKSVRLAGKLVTVVLVGLVVCGAFGVLATDLFGRGGLTAGAESPFSFDVLAAGLAPEKVEGAAAQAASKQVRQPDGDIVVLDDWNYTAIVRGRPQPSKHVRRR